MPPYSSPLPTYIPNPPAISAAVAVAIGLAPVDGFPVVPREASYQVLLCEIHILPESQSQAIPKISSTSNAVPEPEPRETAEAGSAYQINSSLAPLLYNLYILPNSGLKSVLL